MSSTGSGCANTSSSVRASSQPFTLSLRSAGHSTTEQGKAYTCTYFVSAAGVLSVTYEPPFKGLDSFKGEWCVSSRWPKETVEFTGKRVAIVGTGATGCFISAALALISRRFNSRSTTISRVSCCLKAEFEGRKGLACKGATHAPPARRW